MEWIVLALAMAVRGLWLVVQLLAPLLQEHSRRKTLELCLARVRPGTHLLDRRAAGVVIEVSREWNDLGQRDGG